MYKIKTYVLIFGQKVTDRSRLLRWKTGMVLALFHAMGDYLAKSNNPCLKNSLPLKKQTRVGARVINKFRVTSIKVHLLT